jgi:D-arginine dehydrogenase
VPADLEVRDADFAVIGAGIAGASVAHELQAHGRVVLLESEPLPGHHTTGRSAAVLVQNYGNDVVRRLTQASRGFFERPPDGFAPHPLVFARPVLFIGRADQRERLAAEREAGEELGVDVRLLDGAGALSLCPALREDYVAGGLLEPGARGIDVAGMLEGFLRGLRARGGTVRTRAEVVRVEKTGDAWEVEAGGETYRVSAVVNAAGAWCDTVGRLAGARPIGLQPLRRTVITFDGPEGHDFGSWPCVVDVDEEFYFEPEGAQLLASPADETPSEPCDATAEDYEVAVAVDRIERATTLEIRYIRQRWAGLRSFVVDRAPVIGMDPDLHGFFWLAGQGGFGIMTSPAAARTAASLIVRGSLPPDIEELGLTPEQLSPGREGLSRG